MPPAHDHFQIVMGEIHSLREEIREYRREDKSERVALASQVSELQAWKNRQAGALALIGVLTGVVGAALVKAVTYLMAGGGRTPNG